MKVTKRQTDVLVSLATGHQPHLVRAPDENGKGWFVLLMVGGLRGAVNPVVFDELKEQKFIAKYYERGPATFWRMTESGAEALQHALKVGWD